MSREEPEIQPPYNEIFRGLLSFSDFAAAESTIKHLEDLRREYLSAGDMKGIKYCRQIALIGRRRAEQIARNKRVSLPKRLQKKEIAAWFEIWLETPSLFGKWLLMRKETAEFQKLVQCEAANASEKGRDRKAGKRKSRRSPGFS